MHLCQFILRFFLRLFCLLTFNQYLHDLNLKISYNTFVAGQDKTKKVARCHGWTKI